MTSRRKARKNCLHLCPHSLRGEVTPLNRACSSFYVLLLESYQGVIRVRAHIHSLEEAHCA